MANRYPRKRQRGTYLHEWACECGFHCSQGREPGSLGRNVQSWCPGCRRMRSVIVPGHLPDYIPKAQAEPPHRTDLESLVRELVAALKEAERYETDDGLFCPWCGFKEWEGHHHRCPVGLALDHAKEAGFE